jgi:hypothetical protein
MKKAQKRAKRYEQEQAKKHGGKPIGGPGQPDYTRGETKAEVKNWKRPVHSGVIQEAKQKGIKEITSSSGFSQPAIDAAKKAGITLIYRGKRLN